MLLLLINDEPTTKTITATKIQIKGPARIFFRLFMLWA